jgi:predicted house-cleaning noncanonical NTP pyrophosphatase (MazG superfamily)
MRSFMLNKLVKDKVFDNMQALGQQITHRELSTEEFTAELKRKLLEEAQELNAPDSDTKTELSDLLEVIEELAKNSGISLDELRQIQQERGGFSRRLYVERLDLADNDLWASYYAAEPERFLEIKEQ